MCQRSRRLWPSATVHGQRTCSFGWTRGKPERSPAPAVSNKETPWGRQCFVLICDPAKRFREEFEREGVYTFVYIDDGSLRLTGITANTIKAVAFLRRNSEDISVVANTSKSVALPPKGHAPTAEEISLLQSVDVHVAYEGEVTVLGVPIGNDEYVLQ